MNSDTYFSYFMALLGAGCSWFFGELDGLLRILLVMVILDQITGVTKSFILKQWCSDIGFRGIARKIVIFLLVGLAHVIDKELPGQGEALRDAVCCFYIANEGLSILENIIAMKLPVPNSLKERFLSWHNEHSAK